MTFQQQRATTAGRFFKAYAAAAGSAEGTVGYAQARGDWNDRDLVVETAAEVQHAKSAIGAVGQAGSAGALTNTAVGEVLLEMIRPRSLIGRLTQGRFAPLNVRLIDFAGGTSGYAIGEGQAIPLSGAAAGVVTLTPRKVAAIAVVTQELINSTSSKAEASLVSDLAAGVARAQDFAFVDPSVVDSILHQATAIPSNGSSIQEIDADLKSAIMILTAAGTTLLNAAWLMSPTTATSLSLKRDANGTPAFPEVSVLGGVLAGLPVYVSAGVSGYIGLIDQSGLVLADEETVDIQTSTSGTFEMVSDPAGSSMLPTGPNVVSMFQTDSVALRAVLFGGWYLRPSFAAYVRDIQY